MGVLLPTGYPYPTRSTPMQTPKESILKREGGEQMNWGNVLLDGMLVLSVAVVLGTGVTLSYIFVKWAVKEWERNESDSQ